MWQSFQFGFDLQDINAAQGYISQANMVFPNK